MQTYYLKATTEAALWTALGAAGLAHKVYNPDDFRPGTKKGKIDAHPIWRVTIVIPKKLMQDVNTGRENKENNRMAELMKYSQQDAELENVAQEEPSEATTDATV